METPQQPSQIFLPALLLILLLLGCSKQGWLAKIYMVKAEEAYSKAHALRVKKEIPYRKRLNLYREACNNFSKAYQIDLNAFTLNRIVSAAESCLRVEDFKKERLFKEFEEEYIRSHPDETKYGEAGAFIGLEA